MIQAALEAYLAGETAQALGLLADVEATGARAEWLRLARLRLRSELGEEVPGIMPADLCLRAALLAKGDEEGPR